MNRRNFFGRVFGGVAAAALAKEVSITPASSPAPTFDLDRPIVLPSGFYAIRYEDGQETRFTGYVVDIPHESHVTRRWRQRNR